MNNKRLGLAWLVAAGCTGAVIQKLTDLPMPAVGAIFGIGLAIQWAIESVREFKNPYFWLNWRINRTDPGPLRNELKFIRRLWMNGHLDPSRAREMVHEANRKAASE